jgi:Glycosyl transferase family 2
MTFWERVKAAAHRRTHGPYRALSELDQAMHDVQRRLDAIEATAEATHELLNGETQAMLRALVTEESANRRRLRELRTSQDYPLAWSDPLPLVTVTVATRDRPELLASRSLPSILNQSYGELEVIVVGDNADDSVEEAVRSVGDPRVSFHNLPHRLHISDDARRRWLVAATMARNEGTRRAQGRWIVEFDDDDAMRPDCIERLLERARTDRSEVVYGRVLIRVEEGPLFEIGKFPPEIEQFSWAAGMYHAGLRFFQRELFASDLDVPGDWFLVERMLRAGVRFGMVDAALSDIWPAGPASGITRPPRPAP